MGKKVVSFKVSTCGIDAWHAFQIARIQAALDHTGPWPSGTIADKTQISKSALTADQIDGAIHLTDPDGPARHIYLGGGEYLFFGRAHKAYR
jgi:hypothetical protein